MPISMIKRILIGIFSAGWLVPLSIGVSFYYSYLQNDFLQRAQGDVPIGSFPYLAASERCLQASFIWLGIVIFAWSYAGVAALRRRSGP